MKRPDIDDIENISELTEEQYHQILTETAEYLTLDNQWRNFIDAVSYEGGDSLPPEQYRDMQASFYAGVDALSPCITKRLTRIKLFAILTASKSQHTTLHRDAHTWPRCPRNTRSK